MIDWIANNEAAVWWIGATSVLTFVGTLAIIPVLIMRMPADYFVDERPWRQRWPTRHPAVHWTLVLLKNALGLALVLGGLAMLVLPGQGLLTILIGLSLMDFPGKRNAERWLVQRPAIRRAVQWIRHKRGRPPLVLPPGATEPAGP